jgi:hypothetical protein
MIGWKIWNAFPRRRVNLMEDWNSNLSIADSIVGFYTE